MKVGFIIIVNISKYTIINSTVKSSRCTDIHRGGNVGIQFIFRFKK